MNTQTSYYAVYVSKQVYAQRNMGQSQVKHRVPPELDIKLLPEACDKKKVGTYAAETESLHVSNVRWDRLLEYRIYSDQGQSSTLIKSYEKYSSALQQAQMLLEGGMYQNVRVAALTEQDLHYEAAGDGKWSKVQEKRICTCPPAWLLKDHIVPGKE